MRRQATRPSMFRTRAEQCPLPQRAFTLVELLVVITIIVVLLALLAPALNVAIYQAELAVCATKQRGVASGAQMYALGSNRHYPIPPNGRSPAWNPNLGQRGDPLRDIRRIIAGHIPLEMLNCPMVAQVDLSIEAADEAPRINSNTYSNIDTYVFSSTIMYFSWKYTDAAGPGRAGKSMFRLGDPLEWYDEPRNEQNRFRIVVGDEHDWNLQNSTTAHPDKDGVMQNIVRQNEFLAVNTLTWSFWHGADRGPLDLNNTYDDGSVQRMIDVEIDDDRFARLPIQAYGEAPNVFSYLPKN